MMVPELNKVDMSVMPLTWAIRINPASIAKPPAPVTTKA